MLSNLSPYLHTYALHNKYGAYFVLGYALTWLMLGIIWLKSREKVAAYATLFQGFVGLPLAFLFSYFAGTLTGNVDPTIAELSNYIAISQSLGIPLVIYFLKANPRSVPYILSTITGIHFFLYSWLYQTPAYIIMGVVLSVGGLIIMIMGNRNTLIQKKKAPAIISFFTSLTIFAGIAVLILQS